MLVKTPKKVKCWLNMIKWLNENCIKNQQNQPQKTITKYKRKEGTVKLIRWNKSEKSTKYK